MLFRCQFWGRYPATAVHSYDISYWYAVTVKGVGMFTREPFFRTEDKPSRPTVGEGWVSVNPSKERLYNYHTPPPLRPAAKWCCMSYIVMILYLISYPQVLFQINLPRNKWQCNAFTLLKRRKGNTVFGFVAHFHLSPLCTCIIKY
jgi:hypothetical protein